MLPLNGPGRTKSGNPAGRRLALGHLATALVLCVTVIGIPFGLQHVEIAGLTLSPISKTVVREEGAEAAQRS